MPLANSFQRGEEKASRIWSLQIRPALIATEGQKMKIACSVEALQSCGHGRSITRHVFIPPFVPSSFKTERRMGHPRPCSPLPCRSAPFKNQHPRLKSKTWGTQRFLLPTRNLGAPSFALLRRVGGTHRPQHFPECRGAPFKPPPGLSGVIIPDAATPTSHRDVGVAFSTKLTTRRLQFPSSVQCP